MSIEVDLTLKDRKVEIISYLRERTKEYWAEAVRQYGDSQPKEVARHLNAEVNRHRQQLETLTIDVAERQSWARADKLRTLLMLRHCANAVMIEARNAVWPYEYMSFSRRVGELWEPMCALCFEHAPNQELQLFVPPVFTEVKDRLNSDLRTFIEGLDVSPAERQLLLSYYDRVWTLVAAGDIKLALDMHFVIDNTRYVIDFKSGFGSNEKGNTNRLLLVASIYKNVEVDDYRPTLLVRSAEDENNNYLQRLKHSGLWEVACGSAAYERIAEYTGFELGDWVSENVNWPDDLDTGTMEHLRAHDLEKYLEW